MVKVTHITVTLRQYKNTTSFRTSLLWDIIVYVFLSNILYNCVFRLNVTLDSLYFFMNLFEKLSSFRKSDQSVQPLIIQLNSVEFYSLYLIAYFCGGAAIVWSRYVTTLSRLRFPWFGEKSTRREILVVLVVIASLSGHRIPISKSVGIWFCPTQSIYKRIYLAE